MSHQFWWWILWTFWWQLWWLWQNGWISGKTKVSPPPATPAPGEASAPHQQYHPPLRHPPHLLLSPSPSSGRRRVMSVATTPLSTSFFKAFGKDSSSSTHGQFARLCGSDEGLANLAEQFHENNYRRRWVSLSRSVDSDCSSSCSSASSLSPSGSVSDHSDCPDLGSEGGWETDSDVG